ncbi:transposable element Tcb1 transposase [Trichonephila clavipes]|nr:transposable element Tcb1 transposase [Trichonephila clavipes]
MDTERRARSQKPPIPSSREDRHVTRIALMDRVDKSLALSQELGNQVLFTASRWSHPSLSHRGERTLEACIRHRHTGPSSGVMVWGVIGYTSRLPLVHIDGTSNSARYISGVLRPVAIRFIRTLRDPMFQQDNADRILPVLYGSLIWKMFGCGPCLHAHWISCQKKTSCPWLQSDWLVTICRSLRLISCGIVLKLLGHLYLYMPSDLCFTQCSSV